MPIMELNRSDAAIVAALNRVKPKKVRWELNFNTPKEITQKREYMQSPEFLQDPHNIQMFELGEKLTQQREKIGQNVVYQNKSLGRNIFVQGTSGYTLLKDSISTNSKLNFAKEPYMNDSDNNKYYLLLSTIRKKAHDALKKLNINRTHG